MATKEEVLEYIKAIAKLKVITKDELMDAYDSGCEVTAKKLGISGILYSIGGGVVFLGIAILLSQNWSFLGATTKILATFGAGIASYVVGLLFIKEDKTEAVGTAFFLISALVLPLGIFVILDSAGLDAGSFGLQSVTSATLLITFLLSYIALRKIVFVLFCILFATWLYFAFLALIMGGGSGWITSSEYLTLVAGLAYVFLGYSFANNELKPLSGFLYSFGILGFLGSALALGGWEPRQSVFWELVYPILVFATLFFSVHIKNKAFLVWGTLFLMAYILKITSEYFSSGLGWPLALVIAGLAMIGAGYLSISLKNKYLSNK